MADLVPVPVRLSNRDTTHGLCGELLVRFVDPLDAISLPISVSPFLICHDIKAEFDYFRKRVKSRALRKEKANALLRLAKDRFNAASAMPFDLFSLWAYQSLHRDDAPTTGAEVFHELLTWCDAFDGPDAQANTDRLVEVSDLLGCRYTSLMLAFGLYTGYRADRDTGSTADAIDHEAVHILNCIYSFVILQTDLSTDLLCELNFLERAIFLAGTFRSIRASCGGLSATDRFPSAIEVALAVESCVQQTTSIKRASTSASLAQPRRLRRSPPVRRAARKPPPNTTRQDATADRPPQSPPPPAPASSQNNDAASSSQPMPNSTAKHRRSSSEFSSDGEDRPPAAPKRAASRISSSSSSGTSTGSQSSSEDGSSSDGDGPPAPKRRRSARKQPAYSRAPRRRRRRHLHPQARPRAPPSWQLAPPAVHCRDAAGLVMEENILQEQFLDFVSNYHANVSSSGVRFLSYLMDQHRDLVRRRQWQDEQQRRRNGYRAAVSGESSAPQFDHSPHHRHPDESRAHAPPTPPLLAPQPRPLRVRLDEESIVDGAAMVRPSVEAAAEPGDASPAGPDESAPHERHRHDVKDEEVDGFDKENYVCS